MQRYVEQTWNLLTENFCRVLDYKILYIAKRWGRVSVAYGLTCSQACFNIASSVSALLNMFKDVNINVTHKICVRKGFKIVNANKVTQEGCELKPHFDLCQVAHTEISPALITKLTCLHEG